MGVPISQVGYTSATARRGDHESSYEHVVALKKTLFQGIKKLFGYWKLVALPVFQIHFVDCFMPPVVKRKGK